MVLLRSRSPNFALIMLNVVSTFERSSDRAVSQLLSTQTHQVYSVNLIFEAHCPVEFADFSCHKQLPQLL